MSDQDPLAKPELTARDLSFDVAVRGASAKQTAAAMGGDPSHLRSLIAASRDGVDPKVITVGRPIPMVRGQILRQDDLLVTLCLNLYHSVFGDDARCQVAGVEVAAKRDVDGRTIQAIVTVPDSPAKEAVRMQAIAALGFIFTQAEDAWELLDQAADQELDAAARKSASRDFTRAALEFAGPFLQAETDTLMAHLVHLSRRISATDDTSGKQASPAP